MLDKNDFEQFSVIVSEVVDKKLATAYKQLHKLSNGMEEVKLRLHSMDMIIDGIQHSFEKIAIGMKNVESRLKKIEGRLESVENRLETVEGRLESVENRLENVENRLVKVEINLDDNTSLLNSTIKYYSKRAEELDVRVESIEQVKRL